MDVALKVSHKPVADMGAGGEIVSISRPEFISSPNINWATQNNRNRSETEHIYLDLRTEV